jgi:prepilin-type processing-associated H-X9-DG protein
LAPGAASTAIGIDEDDETASALKAAPPGTPGFVGGFASRHPGGTNCAFGDGSVRFLKSSMSPGVLRLLGNRADGEILDSDKF